MLYKNIFVAYLTARCGITILNNYPYLVPNGTFLESNVLIGLLLSDIISTFRLLLTYHCEAGSNQFLTSNNFLYLLASSNGIIGNTTLERKMVIIQPLLFGFIAAAAGITPPGLINMTAAKVSLKDGRNEAISFAVGATVIIFFQTFLALLFANFINCRPDIIKSLQEIGVFIFLTLTIYFFWKAKKPKITKPKTKIRSKANRFFLGILLSALNLFPIPYYVFVSITLAAYGYFTFNKLFILLFVLGVVVGSFLVFYLYILFFKKRATKSSFLINNGNYIIGAITGLVSLFTFLKLIKPYLT